MIFVPHPLSFAEVIALVGATAKDGIASLVDGDGNEQVSLSEPGSAAEREVLRENYAEQIDEAYLGHAISMRLWDTRRAAEVIRCLAEQCGHVISASGTEIRRIDIGTRLHSIEDHLASPTFHYFVEEP